jgi:hypothetical protein
MPKLKPAPPPLNQRPRVEVWEYLEDGLWYCLGEAFPEPCTDPFWIMLVRVLPWWQDGHDDIRSIPLPEEQSYNLLNASG